MVQVWGRSKDFLRVLWTSSAPGLLILLLLKTVFIFGKCGISIIKCFTNCFCFRYKRMMNTNMRVFMPILFLICSQSVLSCFWRDKKLLFLHFYFHLNFYLLSFRFQWTCTWLLLNKWACIWYQFKFLMNFISFHRILYRARYI